MIAPKIDITAAILALRPGASWSLLGDVYSGLDWPEQEQTKPTEEEINAKIEELQAQAYLDACKAEAKQRIAATDWSVLSDVGLQNKSEFETYRAELRALILNPVANPVWPTEPQPVWSN